MTQQSVNVNVRVHAHRHVGCLGALFLSPYYAVKFMVLALAGVLWLYGTLFWYMGCAAAAVCRAVAVLWRSHQAGTLRTAATVSALGRLAGRSFPPPPWMRASTRRAIGWR